MTLKLISWNVNGIRAIEKKGFLDKINELNADTLCLQETKAQDDQVAEVLNQTNLPFYCNSADRKGYSGTAIITKLNPLKVERDMGVEAHDLEGRVLAAEYEQFYLVNVYVPNSGAELARLGYRSSWDVDFMAYLKNLEKTKPVVLCGDLNVAHQPIDLARPKSNYNKTAGYTQVEIDGISNLLNNGFTDTFRYLHP
ncbi:MAG: exodeoxyribonuclease III, partial [Bacteroidales bacterium]